MASSVIGLTVAHTICFNTINKELQRASELLNSDLGDLKKDHTIKCVPRCRQAGDYSARYGKFQEHRGDRHNE